MTRRAQKAQEEAKVIDPDMVNLSTISFPKKYARNRLDKQFGKFLEYMKEISLNVPFIDAIRDMPSWAKFLKDE